MERKTALLCALALTTLLAAGGAQADSDRGRAYGHWKHEHREWREERRHEHDWRRHHHRHARERVVYVREVPVYAPPVFERPRAIVLSTPDIVIPF